jgi:glycosyltransferase involved in cell wall biosynthesis
VRVEAHPTSDGCGLIRLRYPVEVLADQGADVVAARSPLIAEGTSSPVFGRQTHRVRTDADVIVLQRPMDREVIEAIPVMQRQGIAVVVEVDDDFTALPAGHPARKLTAPLVNATHNRKWLAEACRRADLVTVSTPALAKVYGGHGRVRVIRNLIPASYLTVTAKQRGDVLGWTGSTITHVGDLEVVGSGVRRALDATGARFRVVGTGRNVGTQLDLGGRPIDSTGWVPLREYPQAYARLDVAIAPLQPSAFNEAKSALKVLEAAALGVACVASPTSEYIRAGSLGLCMIADTPALWGLALTDLLELDEYRADVAGAARAAAAQLTYEAHAGQWWDAWTEALSNRRGKTAA